MIVIIKHFHKSLSVMLFVVHAPKAAGTALLSLLEQHFGDRLQYDYAEDPADPLSPRNQDPVAYFANGRHPPAGKDCVFGHFHPGKYAYQPTDRLFTILRHPVDNLISIYHFWQTLAVGSSLSDHVVREKLDIFEAASLPILNGLYSRTYFFGFDMNRFTYIGRHDARKQALSRLGEMLQLDLDADHAVNITQASDERQEMLGDPTTRERLSDILADDIAFYERWTG